jgi:hypothetical protein
MRVKTSLTLDETTVPIARARAAAAGLEISRWVERAILNEATRDEVDIINAWEESLPSEERELLAAFAELDRNPTGPTE